MQFWGESANFKCFWWQNTLSFLVVAPFSLQRHNAKKSKQIFVVKELRGLSPNFCIHVLWAIYIFPRSAYSAAGKYVGRSWEYINRSQTHECGNWDWGGAIPFLGIHNLDFRCSFQENVKPKHIFNPIGRLHFSTKCDFYSCECYLDLSFVLNLMYKHMRPAGSIHS